MLTRLLAFLAVGLALSGAAGAAGPAPVPVPRYNHIVVIVLENKDAEWIVGSPHAPRISTLARTYGNAALFYGEVHPSEGNYVAMIGGDTFGINDDDAFYCRPRDPRKYCHGSFAPGYTSHAVEAPNLAQQLDRANISWKGYYENLPAPGSGAVVAAGVAPEPLAPEPSYYASKHSGFMNFRYVQDAPDRSKHIVGFDQLRQDIAGTFPAFALVVPNQCNEMHGLLPPGIPADCDLRRLGELIVRGDTYTGDLVASIMRAPFWKDRGNAAIVITFDESGRWQKTGCCGGFDPASRANFGGGHIPTIVITNHGPRNVEDTTPYNHYSMLRTIEDAFGLEHIAHAADPDAVSMGRLFETH